MSLYAELKRRNVLRMAGLYLVGSWLVVQVAATLLPVFEAPGWVMRVLVALLAIGFVAALVFSWVYELTPEGIKRESEVAADASITRHTGRRMDRLILAGLGLAIAVVAADRLWPESPSEVQPAAKTAAPPAATATPAAAPLQPESGQDAVVDPPAHRIAVLPFLNLSADQAQEYFSDGITEEILNGLARIEALTVTSRTSSFHFKGKDQPLPEIAKALGVDYVLEGSVRTAGSQVRITAQLIRVAGDAHLWSDTWTRELADVFAVQEEVARQVARELEARLTPQDEARLARVGTRNAVAYQAFLRGRHLWSQRTVPSLEAAVAAFREAIEVDPAFVDAWAGLAQTWAILPEYKVVSVDGGYTAEGAYAQALDAAARALALDPACARALAARAYVRVMRQFDWERAEADYRAALAADPRDAGVRQWYGEFLTYQRRWDDAHAQYALALASDPLAAILYTSNAMALHAQGEYAASAERFEQAQRLNPDFTAGRVVRVASLAQSGRLELAAAVAAEATGDERAALVAYVEAMRDPARVAAGIEAVRAHGADTLISKPLLLASLGRHDLALTELERLFAAGDPYRVFLYAMTGFDPLHRDPRFQALLAQIGLPRPATP